MLWYFRFFKEDLLHERLKQSVCQIGLVNSRKNVLCRNLLWDQILCAAQRCFHRKFQWHHYPEKCLIHWRAQKFREHETALTLNAKGKRDTYSGWAKSTKSPENINAIRDSIGQSSKKLLRCHSQELVINCESIRKILVKDLQLYYFRSQIKHKLTQAAMENRVAMCCWFRDKTDENPGFLDNLWLSDEAHFLLSGHVNSKTSSGAQLFQKIAYNAHSIPLNVQSGLPYQNMESLGHTNSRTKVNGHSWSTLSATLKCYRRFGNQYDNEEALRGMVNCFSSMVLPLTPQTKLWNGSDNVLEIASSVTGVKLSGHHIRQT